MTNELKIRTPEGVLFAFPLAGPVSRFLAWGIDLACIGALASLLQILAMVGQLISADFATALLILLYFVLSLGYGIGAEWLWRGQTVGKRLLGLRVMDAQGMRLQFSQVLIRNLLRAIDQLPGAYLVGGLSCLLTRHGQRLGDLAANTVVVRRAKIGEPDLDQLAVGKFNSLREHPHLAMRLRQKINPELARLLLASLVRREQFEPAARVRLFRELGRQVRELVEFPEEATESLTDEQYIRNAAEIVFGR